MKRDVAGGRGFADLSPCVSGRQWFESHLRGLLESLDGTTCKPRFDVRLCEIRWDGNASYPDTTGCYGSPSKFFPPAASSECAQPCELQDSTGSSLPPQCNASCAGRKPSRLAGGRKPLSDFTVADASWGPAQKLGEETDLTGADGVDRHCDPSGRDAVPSQGGAGGAGVRVGRGRCWQAQCPIRDIMLTPLSPVPMAPRPLALPS